MPNDDAAEQYREYAGIKPGHLDVENKSKAGGEIDVEERERLTVEGKPAPDPQQVQDEADTQTAQTDTVEAPATKRASKKAAVAKKRTPAKKTAAKKTAAKKTAAKKTSAKKK